MTNVSPDSLLQRAAEAAGHAHCPYSHYAVGAALLAPDGTCFIGCNVENASFGLTLCAERAAVAAAVAAGARSFQALAIVAAGDRHPYPCGACRQVLAEFCPPDLPIYTARANHLSEFEVSTLGELLPKSFHL